MIKKQFIVWWPIYRGLFRYNGVMGKVGNWFELYFFFLLSSSIQSFSAVFYFITIYLPSTYIYILRFWESFRIRLEVWCCSHFSCFVTPHRFCHIPYCAINNEPHINSCVSLAIVHFMYYNSMHTFFVVVLICTFHFPRCRLLAQYSRFPNKQTHLFLFSQ
jgi:hypothetical protein